MDRRLTLVASLMLAAEAAFAQAPSVPSTGSNAGKTPALAPPAAGGSAGTNATAATPPAAVPGQAGTLLPPMNASGLAAPQVPPPAAVNGVITRSDSATTAFRALDPANRGYVTRAETDRVPGFVGFDNADTNRDGQLTAEEFANAWRFYSGQ